MIEGKNLECPIYITQHTLPITMDVLFLSQQFLIRAVVLFVYLTSNRANANAGEEHFPITYNEVCKIALWHQGKMEPSLIVERCRRDFQ
jgi:hypothetical protein